MFDIEEKLKEFPVIIATGLLGYTWLSQHDPKTPYIPPTKEQVIWEYQNVPLFNRTVDTIVSHLINIKDQETPNPLPVRYKTAKLPRLKPKLFLEKVGDIWTNEDESAEIERQIIDDARR